MDEGKDKARFADEQHKAGPGISIVAVVLGMPKGLGSYVIADSGLQAATMAWGSDAWADMPNGSESLQLQGFGMPTLGAASRSLLSCGERCSILE